jgi:hypothetical protein
MYYETDKNDHGLRYNPLKACVVPAQSAGLRRSTAAGVVNLAPFSFFQLLSYDPPFVMFSAGVHELDGGKKDTGPQCGSNRRVRLQHGDMGAERSDERNSAHCGPRR